MKRETKSILDYLKAIAWVVIPFCLLGSLHYLFVFFPRSFYEKDNHILLNHLGFDYFGIIVGFFSLLVTLLVGWNIFSMVDYRKKFENYKREINTKMDNNSARMEHFICDVEEILQKCDKRIKELDSDSIMLTFQIALNKLKPMDLSDRALVVGFGLLGLSKNESTTRQELSEILIDGIYSLLESDKFPPFSDKELNFLLKQCNGVKSERLSSDMIHIEKLIFNNSYFPKNK